MIVYKATKKQFLEDFRKEVLVNKIIEGYEKNVAKTTYYIVNSWNSSLPYVYLLLEDDRIPDNCGISIEQTIPNIDTKKRIDVMLTGRDSAGRNSVVVLELKQWSKAEHPSDKIGYIVTNSSKETEQVRIHPSFQSWSYSYLLERYNSAFALNNIGVYPCAYLHNYIANKQDVIYYGNYERDIKKAPLFVRGEIDKLREYICNKICTGDNGELIDIIDNSYISICRLFEQGTLNITKDTEHIVLIDEQQLVYEKAMKLAKKCIEDNKKRVLIVKGGPGTGKSILAMKLLADIVLNPENKIITASFVSPIGSQRQVYQYTFKSDKIFAPMVKLIKGSGVFVDSTNNENDILIIDEAHRLRDKSGLFDSKGENQTREIIKSSKFSMFFIDDKQRITLKDKGSVEEIIKRAIQEKAEIEICELTSQFRCNGSSGYIAWIEDILQMRETANHDGFDEDLHYDIRVVDSPHEMRDYIIKKNKKNNASRVVAGYCWDSKKEARADSNILDIEIPKHDFSMGWNLINENWAIAKDSVTRAGCIYTCQGLDFEYIGVIVGKDLIYRDGKVKTDYTQRAKTDNALKGIKTMMRTNKEKAQKIADEIIKNTYRVLLTRGQKGCIIYCEDDALRGYLKERIRKI